MGILCRDVLEFLNLPDSNQPKQSAKDAFYMFAFAHPSRTYSLGVGEYGYKVTKIFWIMQMKMPKMYEMYARKYEI